MRLLSALLVVGLASLSVSIAPLAHATPAREPAAPAVAASVGESARAYVAEQAQALFSPGKAPPSAEAILAYVDVQSVGRFTLGRHARDLPAADFDRYMAAFRAYLGHALSEQLAGLTNAQVKVLDSIERNENDAVVRTQISRPKGDPFDLRWRVVRRGPAWKIVDLEVAGVWLAIQARADAEALLDQHNGDIDAVIQRMLNVADSSGPGKNGRRSAG